MGNAQDGCTSQRQGSALFHLQLKLLDLRFGAFQLQDYLDQCCPPAIAELLLNHGREVRPHHVVFDNQRPLDCHRMVLEMSILGGGSPWFGFAFAEDKWWVHSWLLLDDGTMIDPQEWSSKACWYGVPWGREIYEGLHGGTMDVMALPPVLARSVCSSGRKLWSGRSH